MSSPTPQQQAAIAARGNILVAAGAGTGKTSTVTARCLDLMLRERCSIEQILMVTFTEAAATEMRERIRRKLTEAAHPAAPEDGTAQESDWLAEQLALLETASISTLHSFCLELVRRHFHALGLDPQFTVLDEAQTKPLLHAVLDDLFLRHYESETTTSAAVRELIRQYGRGNDAVIRNCVVRVHRFTQTLAAPAAWFAAQKALFSAPTAEAWRALARQTILAWRDEWLVALAPYAQGSATVRACAASLEPITASAEWKVLATQLKSIETIDRGEWDALKRDFRNPIKAFFEGAQFLAALVEADGAALAEDWQWAREPMLTLLQLTEEFGLAFSAAKRELGGIDFSDQEQFALQLLWKADGSPSSIALECRERFRFVFVDECQDINAAQDAIIRAISRTGADANRFLVGDVKQSIYRFRLAEPEIFQRYQAEWQAAGAAGQTLSLTENFRSAEGLIDFLNPLFRALMRPALGGIAYDAAAELDFGAPEQRAALAAKVDDDPRVELHVLTKEETEFVSEETEAAATRATPDLQTAEREARLIALRLRELKAAGQPVWDRDTNKGFRAVEYADMVVLLRGIAGRAEIFAKVFHQLGVPLVAGRSGFLTALEVSDVLNLLRLLDNPLQDLPLLAVLRSPLVGLSANELARIRINRRKGLLWPALQQTIASEATTELQPKLRDFLDRYARWRELIRHTSLTQCLETALRETHYESLLLADERGTERVANVRRLVEMARRFDPFQREGLYRFLQFISEQEEAEVDHPPADTTHANAVRLMTIHASKGLEFPVVVLAGMGGRFNLRDLSADILLDQELGLCPKIFPPQSRSKYPSLAHWSASQRERRAQLGEELRLLYVASTRARDRLILVGTATRKQELDRWQAGAPATDHALTRAGSYLDWIRLWFTNAIPAAAWNSAHKGETKLLHWRFWNANDTVFAPTTSDEAPTAPTTLPSNLQLSEIRAALNFNYPHDKSVQEPAKTSVTSLRRRAQVEFEESRQPFKSEAALSSGPQKLSAAEVGTAHHTFLQFVTLAETGTEVSLRNEAQRLEQAGALSAAQAAVLDFDALSSFWQSALGIRLRQQPEAFINREMPFTAKFHAVEVAALLSAGNQPEISATPTDDDFVIVQGIADLAVIGPEEIWLVDFKTDHLTASEIRQRTGHYEPQMRFYAQALAKIFHRPVTQCWLHFLSLNQSVAIDLNPGRPLQKPAKTTPTKPKDPPPNGQLVFEWVKH